MDKIDWFEKWKQSNQNIKEFLQKQSIINLKQICKDKQLSGFKNRMTKHQLINLIIEELITSLNCKQIKRKKINEKDDACDNYRGICTWKDRKCIQFSPLKQSISPHPLNTNMRDVYSMYLKALNISKIPKKEFDKNHCKFTRRILNNLGKYDRPTTREISENALEYLDTISGDKFNLFCFQIKMFVEMIDSNKDIGCPFNEVTKETGVTESEYDQWMKNPSMRPKKGTFEYSKMQEAMGIKFCCLLRYLILSNLSDVVHGKKAYNKYSFATAKKNIYKNRKIEIPQKIETKCEEKYYPQLEIRKNTQ